MRTRPVIERWWDGALEKVRREGKCRVCSATWGIQAAHTVARKYDQCVEMDDGTLARFVDPSDIIPLCVQCHADYDSRKLSILPVLTYQEQANAVAHLGIERALHRLTGQRRASTVVA